MISRTTLALALFLLPSPAAAQLAPSAEAQALPGAPTYQRQDGAWYRLENGRAYRVYEGEVTVKLAAGLADFDAFRAALGGLAPAVAETLGELELARSNRLGFLDLALPAGADPLATVALLRESGLVELAEEATIGEYEGTPNDPMFGQCWHLQNVGQSGGTPGADVHALGAWLTEDGDPSVVVAVVDSGTEWSHPDLAANMWGNPGEVPDNGVDDDGNGFVDDVLGWNFESGNNDPSSGFYHGTGVASCVAAVGNNGVGIAGLAGGASDGQGASIMALRVGEFGPISSIIDDAILYAADNGARVITMSLGIGTDTAVTNAINQAVNVHGVFVNCSAGNGGSISYPATLADVVAVGGTNDDDGYPGFSTGSQMDVAAPSSNIFMADLGGGYTTSSGTSFGSPMVAALAALVISLNPALQPADVRQLIRNGADDIGAPGFDNQFGFGRINAEATLALADLSVQLFGSGTPTGLGLVPKISSGGQPADHGNGSFKIALDQVRPGTLAAVVVGFGGGPVSIPFAGGTFYVDPVLPWLVDSFTVDGNGHAELPLPLPDDPTISGAVFVAQWLVFDPVVQLALSPALVMTVDA